MKKNKYLLLLLLILIGLIIPKAISANTRANITVNNYADLKSNIEGATTDITVELDGSNYNFLMDGANTPEIKNTNNIKVTIIGSVDTDGFPTTTFTMDAGVSQYTRFVKIPNGTLEVSNINFNGVSNVSGGIHAKDIKAINCVFTNNFGGESIAGGGAINVSRDMHIEKSTFRNNTTGATQDGGAVAVEYGGSVFIDESDFYNNSRTGNNNQYGGAISIKQPGISGSTITISNAIFDGNTVNATGPWTRGGAIHILGNNNIASLLIDNVLFKDNTSNNNGGGLALMVVSNATIQNCTFINNSTSKYGGGLYLENSNGTNELINSTFIGNRITGFGSGNGIGLYASSIAIDSNTIINNTIGFPGTGSSATIKDSIITASNMYTSTKLTYLGTNVARKASTEPAVVLTDVIIGGTVTDMVSKSDSNYTFDIKKTGDAYQKISTSRRLPVAQNGVTRKALSDIGAHEAAEELLVFFDAQGGTPAPTSQSLIAGDLVVLPTAPAKTGYVFSGWYTTAATGGSLWDFTNDTVVTTMTLYARYTPKSDIVVSFEADNGATNPDDISVTFNAAYGTLPVVSKIGYTFNGWYTTATGGTLVNDTTIVTNTVNHTLYAQYTPKSDIVVSFEADNGQINPSDITVTFNAVYGTLPVVNKIGYTFMGWYTSATGGSLVSDTTIVTNAVNHTLYAQYTKDIVTPIRPDKPIVNKPITDNVIVQTGSQLNLVVIPLLISLIGIQGIRFKYLKK